MIDSDNNVLNIKMKHFCEEKESVPNINHRGKYF
jgi:hypothetical protein